MNFFYKLLMFTLMICGTQLYAIQFRVSNTDTLSPGFAKTVYVQLVDNRYPTIMRTTPYAIASGKTVTIDAPHLGKYKMKIQFQDIMDIGIERFKDIEITQNNELIKLPAAELKKFYDELKPIYENRVNERQRARERISQTKEERHRRAAESGY